MFPLEHLGSARTILSCWTQKLMKRWPESMDFLKGINKWSALHRVRIETDQLVPWYWAGDPVSNDCSQLANSWSPEREQQHVKSSLVYGSAVCQVDVLMLSVWGMWSMPRPGLCTFWGYWGIFRRLSWIQLNPTLRHRWLKALQISSETFGFNQSTPLLKYKFNIGALIQDFIAYF